MTDEQLKKIAWLDRAFYAEKSVKAWMEKCERERSFAQRLSRTFSGNSSGCSGNSTEDTLIRLIDAERKSKERLNQLVRIREEITETILNVRDDELQAVLVWHYLHYLTFEQIAEKMHYEERTIRRKHKQALDEIVL